MLKFLYPIKPSACLIFINLDVSAYLHQIPLDPFRFHTKSSPFLLGRYLWLTRLIFLHNTTTTDSMILNKSHRETIDDYSSSDATNSPHELISMPTLFEHNDPKGT